MNEAIKETLIKLLNNEEVRTLIKGILFRVGIGRHYYFRYQGKRKEIVVNFRSMPNAIYF
jgi:hypothetical protein